MLKLVLGIGVGILLVTVAYLTISFLLFARSIEAERDRLVAAAEPNETTVSEERLASLPIPVQRHLRQAGVVGQKIPRVVTLTQTGRIRNAPDSAWMTFTAEETYSTNPPAFVWRAWLPSRAMPVVFGRDHYLGGDGRITMKLLGTVPVADIGSTATMNEASLMRYLNEIMWFPAAYVGDNLTWAPVDDTSADVTIADGGMSATARLFFDADGRFVNFRAERFNTTSNSIQTWETPLDEQKSFAGINLPVSGAAVWQTDTGPFAYIELEVTGVRYE